MYKLIIDYVELISLNFYKIVFKPILYNEFLCNTVLNFLKHSIYLNIPGWKITEISFIENNINEFSYVFGIKEDILNLILNLKGVVLKSKKKLLVLEFKCSKKIIKAKDIKSKNKDIKIINPDHVICHNSGVSLNFKVKIEKGVGFKNFNSNKNFKNYSILKNGILIDSNFNPIIRCFYNLEKLEDSIFENLNIINFFIETDGTIDGKRAIIYSINKSLKIFYNLKISNYFKNNLKFDKFNIINFNFSLRTIKYLYDLNIYNFKDVINLNRSKIHENVFFSKKTSKEINNFFKI